jgi:hypothetical protein
MRGGTDSEEKRAKRLADKAEMNKKREEMKKKREEEEAELEQRGLSLLDENLARAESADNRYHKDKRNVERMNEEYGKEFQSFKYDANSPYKPAEKRKKEGLLKRLFGRTKKNSPTLPAEQMPPKQPGFTAYYPKKSASKTKSSAEYETIRSAKWSQNKGADINVPSYKSPKATSPKATSPKASYISVRSVKKTKKRGPNVAALAAKFEGSKF